MTRNDDLFNMSDIFKGQSNVRKYQQKYIKTNYRTFVIRLRKDDDQEIIQHLLTKNSISGYIKELIENDLYL